MTAEDMRRFRAEKRAAESAERLKGLDALASATEEPSIAVIALVVVGVLARELAAIREAIEDLP